VDWLNRYDRAELPPQGLPDQTVRVGRRGRNVIRVHAVNFRYTPPKGPAAGAVTGVGKVAILVQLTLAGELDIVWRRQGVRDQAGAEALVALLDGLLVSHLDTPTPVILASPTRRFVQKSRVFHPPGAMICQGQCAVKMLGGPLTYKELSPIGSTSSPSATAVPPGPCRRIPRGNGVNSSVPL
jgi:hypothetical protein